MRVAVFDLDGTLSSSAWRQELADKKMWVGYHELLGYDTPIPLLIHQLRWHQDQGDRIAICTARRKTPSTIMSTNRWLARWQILVHLGVRYRELDDRRPGPQVKCDLLKAILDEGHEVVAFYEDQPRICEALLRHTERVVHVEDPGLPPLLLSPRTVRTMLDEKLRAGV